MSKGQPQGSVAAHRNTADRASLTARPDAVLALDVRDELLQKEIAVAHRAVGRIDVKTAPALGRGDKKITHLVLIAQIVEQSPSATVKQRLFVVAQAVQKIQHGISSRRSLCRTRVVARRQINAIVDAPLQNLAVQRAAIDAALRDRRRSEK